MSIPRSTDGSSASGQPERALTSRLGGWPLALGALLGSLALLAGCAPAGTDAVDPAASGGPLTVAETPSSAQTAGGEFISWREHRIDDEELSGGVPLRGADGLKMADLDGDGHLDIVSVHEDSDHVRLHFGSDDPDRWASVTLAGGKEAAAAEDIAIGDVNNDGLLDVLVACELDHLTYFQNPGTGVRDGRWPRLIPSVTAGRGSWIRVFLADLDQDGRLEAIAPNKGAQQPEGEPVPDTFPLEEVSLFRIDGDPLVDSSWTETVLATVTVPMNSRPVDLDGDGDLDILAGSRSEARIFWLENLLEAGSGELAFEEHPIEIAGRTVPWQPGPRRLTGMNVEFADLNHDGRLDLVLQETPVLNVWLEQPPDPTVEPWTIHVIGDTAPDNPTGLALFDIDDDGDLDLWSGGYSSRPRDRDGEDKTAKSVAGRLGWFANPGDPTGEWTRHDVSRRVRGMFDEFVVLDMDQDGDSDLVATRGNSGHYDGVFWLEQVRTAEPRRSLFPARESESRHLPLPPGD